MKSEAIILIKLQFVIYQWIRLNELYKLMELLQTNKLLSNFEFVVKFLAENFQTNIEPLAGLRFYPKYLMLYINGFVSTSSTI